ncbi:MAG: DUF6580 family putative transport protein [Patescibacteria group bacterium]
MWKKTAAACGLVLIGIAGRLIPHLPNASPINAIAIAAGKYLGRGWSVAIPLAAMLASDAIIGFYDLRILASVYGSFMLVGWLSELARRYSGPLSTVIVALVAPLVFFLITNTAVWAYSPWYEKSAEGLFLSYSLGLPFMRNMLVGDLIYVPLILSVWMLGAALMRTRAVKLPPQVARA